jgi:sulfur-carrier protein
MALLRYWAAAKEAAGVAEEEFAGVSTLEELLVAAVAGRSDGGRLGRVLERCAYLVDEQPVGLRPHGEVTLGPAALVEALPPFAGG